MPRTVFEKLSTAQMLDVLIPTTDGRELLLTRHTEPSRDVIESLVALSFSLHLHPIHFQRVAQESDFTIMATAWFSANPGSVADRVPER